MGFFNQVFYVSSYNDTITANKEDTYITLNTTYIEGQNIQIVDQIGANWTKNLNYTIDGNTITFINALPDDMTFYINITN